MADPHQAAANRHLRMLFDAGTVVGLSDGQLLELFETRREETAFTALIERHGPMVQRVCGEILGNHHDAEDAFQATFLVLARHAGSIRRRDSVASWLYGVALRVAACSRSATARRRRHERNWAALRSAEVSDEAERREDFGPLLHAELGRLPERFRAPVVLCYLEGRTYEEAAGLLRCPVGTIKSRLSTARQRLRRRLEPVALTGSIESEPRAEAVVVAVPARLVETTVHAATQGAASGVVSVTVARLVERVVSAMFLNRLSAAACALVVVAVLATGASGWAWQATGGGDAARAKAADPPQANAATRPSEPQAPVPAGNLTNLAGRVIDEQGKPVADAPVVLFTPRSIRGSEEPVEVETKTDAGGHFQFVFPRRKRAVSRLWSYRPGSAIAVRASDTPPFDMVLRRPQPRTVTIVGPDGRPVPGAILSPQILNVTGGRDREDIPEALAAPLAVTSGQDGKATLNYLGGGDKLVAVRLTAASVGTQELQLLDNPGRDNQGAAITVRLKPTRRLAGRVRNRARQPVAAQEVEVWSRGGNLLRMDPVGFQDGPLKTEADGSFRTPDNLLVGSSYQVVIRAPGFEPILSKWITIGEQPPLLMPMLQRPLRTIRGRVVDRQGKPLSDVEVFQSGDGPERTATKTDGDGRFALGGFREGSVFLFARRGGFRYYGRLIKPGEENIAVELIRIGEQPAPELRTLPPLIPDEESRALTRRLMEPCWQAALAQKDPDAAYRALVCLAPADPLGVLQKLESEDSVTPLRVPFIKAAVARALARIDPARAEKVAESIDSPGTRGTALAGVAEALPAEARDRKLALLARAAVHAKAAKEPLAVFAVALRLLDLGEKETVKALVAEYVGVGKVLPQQRITFGYRLVRIDPPAALSIAKELSTSDPATANLLLRNVAFTLSADNPVEAERVLRMVPQEEGQRWLAPAIAWKLAMSDPACARRLVDETQRYYDSPEAYLYLAYGLKGRDPAAADEAFWKGIQGIDRLLEEGAESLAMQIRGGAGALMPLVEQIDPSLVPEVFWRAVAARPAIGNPRSLNGPSLSELVQLLSWYDRDVAAAVFETNRVMMEQVDDRELASRVNWFLSWLVLDPRATLARIEQLRATTDLDAKAILELRENVGSRLGQSYEDQWRRVWYLRGYGRMKAPLDGDIW